VSVFLALVAVAWGQLVVLVWASAIAGMGVAASIWSKGAWKGVTVEVGFEPSRAFIGEPITVRVRIVNDKRLPIPIVRILVPFPEGLLSDPEAGPTSLRGHRRRFSLAGRSEVTLRLPVVARSRGEYWLEAVGMELADPFDLAPVGRQIHVEGSLLVMPEPQTGLPLRVVRRLPFGSPAAAARLFEDREHFAGVREYEPGDPMHHVHWRVSAHAGRLQTKRFEPTRSAEVLFALDLSNGEPFWHGVDPPLAEETIGWASYLARQAIHAGWRTGMVANTHLRRGRGPLRVPTATTVGAEAVLFGALARMPNQPTVDLAPILREIGRRLVRRTTVIVVSPRPGPWLVHEMDVLRRRGSGVVHVSPLEGYRGEARAS
jgi:uncharacterized protein (DUF58 family)